MIKTTFESTFITFSLIWGNYLPPQLTAIALFQHINPCNYSKSLEISLKYSVNINVQKYIATGCLDNLFILNFMNLSWQTWYLLFCKMVINKTILMVISLSNRNCPYEFNASVDCWRKSTSHYDVIAPSTVSTIQNNKLLTSRNLCHFFMFCHVTRSQHMACDTLWRPTRISRAI